MSYRGKASIAQTVQTTYATRSSGVMDQAVDRVL